MYTNRYEVSDKFCRVKIAVNIDETDLGIDAEQLNHVMAEIAVTAKAMVMDKYKKFSKAPHNLSEPLMQERCEPMEDSMGSNKTMEIAPHGAIKPKNDSGFNFRDRLPNNVIDITELTIEKAVTENSLVRCPSCGQAHCLAVNSGNHVYFMARDYEKDEFSIISSYDSLNNKLFAEICRDKDGDFAEYYRLIRELPFSKENEDFAVDNNTEIFCPVCHDSASFFNWKKAYDQPLNFFETENLCDACGGERVEKHIHKMKTLKCEKCNLEIPTLE